MSRLKLTDGVYDILIKMAEGNPGAVRCLTDMLIKNDWYGNVPATIVIMHLDDIGIYGSHLYVLVNDCCDNDLNELDKVMRNYQFGIISKEFIQEKAMSGRGTPFTDLHTIEELVNGWYLLGNSEEEPVSELRAKQLSEEGRYTDEEGKDYAESSKLMDKANFPDFSTISKDESPSTLTVRVLKTRPGIHDENFIMGVDFSTGSDYTGITKIDADGKTNTTLTRDEKPTDN